MAVVDFDKSRHSKRLRVPKDRVITCHGCGTEISIKAHDDDKQIINSGTISSLRNRVIDLEDALREIYAERGEDQFISEIVNRVLE